MKEKIIREIADSLGLEAEKIQSSDRLMEDLGADSLDAVELTMSLEEEYGFFVEEEDLAGFKTVGDIIDYVLARLDQ